MTIPTNTPPVVNALQKSDSPQELTYIPLGGSKMIKITMAMVANDIAKPTKKGIKPTENDCRRFMNLCEARQLNPWEGDCYMIGYDTSDGPEFNLITAIQALQKRAEMNPAYEGSESGIILAAEGGVEYRPGSVMMANETLIGGWCKVYRNDRRVPHTAYVDFKTYNSGRSRWAKDRAGMIQKCARAAALREAFPTTLSQMYTGEEFDRVIEDAETLPTVAPRTITHTEPAATEEPATTEEPAETLSPELESLREEWKRLGDVAKRYHANLSAVEETGALDDVMVTIEAARNDGGFDQREFDILERFAAYQSRQLLPAE